MEQRLRLGDILIQSGNITKEQLDVALEMQKNDRSKRIGQILMGLGYITEDELLSALSRRLWMDVVDLKGEKVDLETVASIPKQVSIKYNIIAIYRTSGSIVLVLNDPLDFYAIEDVKSFLTAPSKIVLSKSDDIRRVIEKSYSELDARSAATAANNTIGARVEAQLTDLSGDNHDNPIVNVVNSILLKAHSEGASDIHFEPFEHQIKIRLRIDGQLLEYMQLESDLAGQIATRIKILADLDIAARRAPQDGNFKIQVSGQNVGVRVSVIPTSFGEKIVLRFLSQSVALDNAGQYGMNQENHQKISRILQNPHGIIYITGPTGSGKTTTLYMMIEEMAKKPINVSTIEDPVERNLPGINQVQVNPAAGLTFEAGLRSMLRQDPDVLLVGETRDSETAQIAVSAAITGHLVLSTLHTNDAISSVVRLQDMGIPSYLVANSLAGLVAQRLVKKICPACKAAYALNDVEKVMLPNLTHVYRGKGCNACNHTGYKGRIAIHEVLEVDREVRRIIAAQEPSENLYDYVRREKKMIFMKDNIYQLVQDGVTTTEEYIRQTAFAL